MLQLEAAEKAPRKVPDKSPAQRPPRNRPFRRDGRLRRQTMFPGYPGATGPNPQVNIVPKVLDFYGYYGWNWVGARHSPGGG